MVHRPNTGLRMRDLLLLTLLTAAMPAPAVVRLGTEVWEGNPAGSQSILAWDIFAHTNRAKPNNTEHDHDLKEGERVVIKNTYLGKKGTEGTISYTTKAQVMLQVESGTFHTRKFTNVKRVKKRENE